MKKGFTLIELICVIVLLGIIAMIAIPTINTAINNSKEKAYNEQIALIEDTAKTYTSKHSLKLPNQTNGSKLCVSVAEMQKDGLLTSEAIQNPNYEEGSTDAKKKNKTFTGSVVITWKSNKYLYKYEQNPSC